jgi:hypothetical protein
LYDRTLVLVTDPTERTAVNEAKFKKYPELKLPPGGTIVLFHVSRMPAVAVQLVELMRIVNTGANNASGKAILRSVPAAGVAPNTLLAAVRSDLAANEIRPLLR